MAYMYSNLIQIAQAWRSPEIFNISVLQIKTVVCDCRETSDRLESTSSCHQILNIVNPAFSGLEGYCR